MTVFNKKQLALSVAIILLGSNAWAAFREMPLPPPGPFVSEGKEPSTVRPGMAEASPQAKAQAAKTL